MCASTVPMICSRGMEGELVFVCRRLPANEKIIASVCSVPRAKRVVNPLTTGDGNDEGDFVVAVEGQGVPLFRANKFAVDEDRHQAGIVLCRFETGAFVQEAVHGVLKVAAVHSHFALVIGVFAQR